MAEVQREVHPPRRSLEEWNQFHTALIKFVKKNPILYEPRTLTSLGANAACSAIWDQFCEKWHIDKKHCKSIWWGIRDTYVKIKAEPDKYSDRRKMKFLGGRLSFLDPYFEHIMLEKEKKNRLKKTSVNRTSEKKEIDKKTSDKREIIEPKTYQNPLIVTESTKTCCNDYLKQVAELNEFEIRLIDYVKNYPILYDARVSLNIQSVIRQKQEKKLWKVLSIKTGVSDAVCRENWSKVRLNYFCVRKALDSNIEIQKPSLLKYLEGILKFLEPVYSAINVFPIDIMTREPLEDIIKNRQCAWDDFELNVIEFVKENPVIYDLKIIKPENTFEDFWNELSSNLGVSADRCIQCWNHIKHENLLFMRRYSGKKLDYSSLFDFRFKVLSFLNERDECKEVFNVTFDENIDNPSDIEKFDDATKSNEEEPIKLEPKEVTNLYKIEIEIEDPAFLHNNMNIKPDIVLRNVEPQPSTSEYANVRCEDAINCLSNKNKEKNSSSLCVANARIKEEPEELLDINNEEIETENADSVDSINNNGLKRYICKVENEDSDEDDRFCMNKEPIEIELKEVNDAYVTNMKTQDIGYVDITAPNYSNNLPHNYKPQLLTSPNMVSSRNANLNDGFLRNKGGVKRFKSIIKKVSAEEIINLNKSNENTHLNTYPTHIFKEKRIKLQPKEASDVCNINKETYNHGPQPSTSADFVSSSVENFKDVALKNKGGVTKYNTEIKSNDDSEGIVNWNKNVMEENLIKLEPTEESIFYCTNMEAVDTSSDLVSHNDKPQVAKLPSHVDSKSTDSRNVDDKRCTSKEYKPVNTLNLKKLSTKDFFQHIGTLVSERYSEEIQQEIRSKCLALINSIK